MSSNCNVMKVNDSKEILINVKIEDTDSVVHLSEFLDIVVESPVKKEELLIPEQKPFDNNDDPLEDKVQNSNTKFVGEYNESDFLLKDEGNALLKTQKISIGRSRKRQLNEEIIAQSGYVWTTRAVEEVCRECQFFSIKPQGKGPSSKVSNPLETWNLLIDEPILLRIVKCTNDEIRSHNTYRTTYQHTIDLIELRVWIGLTYLIGIFRNSQYNGPLEELWTLELGNVIFRSAMSFKRYEYISEMIRFSEIKSENATISIDCVHHIWEKFLINCRSFYAPSGNCAIGENIIVVDETQFGCNSLMPANVKNSELRMITLCDTKTLYMCNAIWRVEPSAIERDVLQLICDIKGTKRNIVLEKSYTSLQIAKLLRGKELTVLGELSPTSTDIPQQFISNKTATVLYGESSSLSLNKSTAEDNSLCFILDGGVSPKTDASKLFRCTQDSCQRFQQKSKIYSTNNAGTCKSNGWTLRLFHAILDIAAFNAWILLRLSANGDAAFLQRDFLRQLGLYLTQQHLKRRLENNKKLPLMQKLLICEMLGEPTEKFLNEIPGGDKSNNAVGKIQTERVKLPEDVTLMSKHCENRKRCRKCPSAKSCKTRTRCQQCLRPLCGKHLLMRCADCTGLEA
ncbi:uncharacterized protein LOC119684172 [Teleopsis dalmanni]|uniref:uncharacterized protein LOC119684172 n=1 Tax=Teleopsis dalmanni TaxID=139649 RepID=UPI0018CF3E8C|nr:uncharacterized protein LOC119684172 [Teleopsis dalmanni]